MSGDIVVVSKGISMLTVTGFTFYNPSVSTRSTVIFDDTGTVIGISKLQQLLILL